MAQHAPMDVDTAAEDEEDLTPVFWAPSASQDLSSLLVQTDSGIASGNATGNLNFTPTRALTSAFRASNLASHPASNPDSSISSTSTYTSSSAATASNIQAAGPGIAGGRRPQRRNRSMPMSAVAGSSNGGGGMWLPGTRSASSPYPTMAMAPRPATSTSNPGSGMTTPLPLPLPARLLTPTSNAHFSPSQLSPGSPSQSQQTPKASTIDLLINQVEQRLTRSAGRKREREKLLSSGGVGRERGSGSANATASSGGSRRSASSLQNTPAHAQSPSPAIGLQLGASHLPSTDAASTPSPAPGPASNHLLPTLAAIPNPMTHLQPYPASKPFKSPSPTKRDAASASGQLHCQRKALGMRPSPGTGRALGMTRSGGMLAPALPPAGVNKRVQQLSQAQPQGKENHHQPQHQPSPASGPAHMQIRASKATPALSSRAVAPLAAASSNSTLQGHVAGGGFQSAAAVGGEAGTSAARSGLAGHREGVQGVETSEAGNDSLESIDDGMDGLFQGGGEDVEAFLMAL